MSRWRSFLKGCMRPCGVSVALALITAIGAFAIAAVTIDERLVGSPAGRDLLRYRRSDDDLEVTSLTLEMRDRDLDRPLVIIAGASETREMLDHARFRAMVAGDGPEPVETILLAQPRQGLEEVGRIVELIPDGTRGVFVLSLGIGRFVENDGREGNELLWPRLGFRTEQRDRELRALGFVPPPRTGIFLVDNVRFYSLRLMALPRNLLLGPPPLWVNRYDDRVPMTDEDWEEKARQIQARIGSFDASFPGKSRKLTRVIDDLRRRTRMRVIASMLPANPRFVSEVLGEERYRTMTGRIAEMLRAEGLTIAELDAARLSIDDYWDWIHIRSSTARARTTDILAAAVQRALQARGDTP